MDTTRAQTYKRDINPIDKEFHFPSSPNNCFFWNSSYKGKCVATSCIHLATSRPCNGASIPLEHDTITSQGPEELVGASDHVSAKLKELIRSRNLQA